MDADIYAAMCGREMRCVSRWVLQEVLLFCGIGGKEIKEYIEKAMAFSVLVDFPGELSPENIGLAAARKAIDALPAADVAEVVRCKDCRYYPTAKVNEKGFLICPASGMEITETDYCSYGAHMDKEDEHEQ